MSSSAMMTKTIDQLTGRQKAAVILMVLGTEATAHITQRLLPEEVEAISYEIARVEHVAPEVVDAVLFEWAETVRAAELLANGGVEFAREVLERAFGPERAESMFRRIQAQLSENAGLNRLRRVDPHHLASMLRNEHPQTIAVVLAHLDPAQTASILRELGSGVGAAAVNRLARLEKVSPEMLELIARALGPETELNLSQGMSNLGGPQAVAQVLNLVAPSLEKEMLDSLAADDPELCEEIKNLMFVFEDIVTLDDRSVQRVLRDIDSKELALALKTASPELKSKIMGAMSKRAVEALEEEMEFLGPVRVRDVETAQVAIVTRIRALEEAGEIVVSGGTDALVQ